MSKQTEKTNLNWLFSIRVLNFSHELSVCAQITTIKLFVSLIVFCS